jgi:ATP-dependent DNA ligase
VGLKVKPPVSPMLVKLAREMPIGDQWWAYEPKWDGFRCIVFRDGDDIELGSRNEKPLTRYFPDLVEPLLAALPDGAVVDGEIVIKTPDGLDFDLLSLRIHPAASRVAMLAEETPAAFVAFDLLAEGKQDLRARPFEERRAGLERMLGAADSQVHLTPLTRDPAVAQQWFETFEGAGLDGVVAKDLTGEYKEGERGWLQGQAPLRTADCVVAGFHAQGRQASDHCCSAFTTTRASCNTSAWRRASTRRAARSWSGSWRSTARTASRATHGRNGEGRKGTNKGSGCPARRVGGTPRRT